MAQKNNRRKSKIVPEAMFEHAMSFHTAFKHLYQTWMPRHPAGRNAVVTPAAVLNAFASELLLKMLVLIETGSVPKTHHLLTLFKSLAPKTRNLIEERWDKYAIDHAHRWAEFDQ